MADATDTPNLPELTVIVRDHSDADLDVLERMAIALHTHVIALDPIGRLRMQPGYGAEAMRDLLDPGRRQGRVLVATTGDGAAAPVIGFAAGFVADEQSATNLLSVIPTRLGVISDLYVVPEWRGHHVGTMLMDGIEDHLRSQGCDSLWIDIVAFNVDAHAFYAQRGYAAREIGLLRATH